MLLLYTDRSDPVACAILDNPGRFEREVIAISLHQLLREVAVGATWKWAGRAIDPSRTAVVNRLTSLEAADVAGQPCSSFQRTQTWIWLSGELQRFAYASSLPTASSVLGGYGSLLDPVAGRASARRPDFASPPIGRRWNNAMPNGDALTSSIRWQLLQPGAPDVRRNGNECGRRARLCSPGRNADARRASGKHLFSRQCAARRGGRPSRTTSRHSRIRWRACPRREFWSMHSSLEMSFPSLRYVSGTLCSPERSRPIRIWSFEGCVMTSNDVAAGLLDQLNYLGGGGPRGILPAGFAFDLDFGFCAAWPDLPYDTASPVSHYGLEARPEILRILEAAASLCPAPRRPRRGSSSIESSRVP